MTEDERFEDIVARVTPNMQAAARSFYEGNQSLTKQRRLEVLVSAWFGGEDPTLEPQDGLIRALLSR